MKKILLCLFLVLGLSSHSFANENDICKSQFYEAVEKEDFEIDISKVSECGKQSLETGVFATSITQLFYEPSKTILSIFELEPKRQPTDGGKLREMAEILVITATKFVFFIMLFFTLSILFKFIYNQSTGNTLTVEDNPRVIKGVVAFCVLVAVIDGYNIVQYMIVGFMFAGIYLANCFALIFFLFMAMNMSSGVEAIHEQQSKVEFQIESLGYSEYTKTSIIESNVCDIVHREELLNKDENGKFKECLKTGVANGQSFDDYYTNEVLNKFPNNYIQKDQYKTRFCSTIVENDLEKVKESAMTCGSNMFQKHSKIINEEKANEIFNEARLIAEKTRAEYCIRYKGSFINREKYFCADTSYTEDLEGNVKKYDPVSSFSFHNYNELFRDLSYNSLSEREVEKYKERVAESFYDDYRNGFITVLATPVRYLDLVKSYDANNVQESIHTIYSNEDGINYENSDYERTINLLSTIQPSFQMNGIQNVLKDKYASLTLMSFAHENALKVLYLSAQMEAGEQFFNYMHRTVSNSNESSAYLKISDTIDFVGGYVRYFSFLLFLFGYIMPIAIFLFGLQYLIALLRKFVVLNILSFNFAFKHLFFSLDPKVDGRDIFNEWMQYSIMVIVSAPIIVISATSSMLLSIVISMLTTKSAYHFLDTNSIFNLDGSSFIINILIMIAMTMVISVLCVYGMWKAGKFTYKLSNNFRDKLGLDIEDENIFGAFLSAMSGKGVGKLINKRGKK